MTDGATTESLGRGGHRPDPGCERIRLSRINLVGGGARNRVLCQATANATGRPVIAGPAEATALCNVIVQLVALGDVGSAAEGASWRA
jgi:sugar (pentulose or hexulose) kinase